MLAALGMVVSAGSTRLAGAAEVPEPASEATPTGPAGLAEVPRVEVPRVEVPRVELWTMGQGEDVFERFGHAALCVYDLADADGRCFNYGTTNFTDPAQLVRRFLRREAPFWVSVGSADRTLEIYQEADRTIWIQPLPLTLAQTGLLVARLQHDALPENREYVYDHFVDNCTTRVRDHIDAVTGGALRPRGEERFGPTWREMVRAGFAADVEMLALAELLMGRSTDGHPTRWQAMYHPDVLRVAVWEHLGVEPEVVAERRGRDLTAPPLAGRRALVLVAIGLALGCGLLVTSGRRVPRRLGLVVAGLVLGGAALIVDVTTLYTLIVDLRANEVAFVLLPTDLAIAFVGGRALRGYLNVRLATLLLVALASLAGWLVQPLGPVLVLAGLPLGALRIGLSEGRYSWRGRRV